jgi:hypothetical protein
MRIRMRIRIPSPLKHDYAFIVNKYNKISQCNIVVHGETTGLGMRKHELQLLLKKYLPPGPGPRDRFNAYLDPKKFTALKRHKKHYEEGGAKFTKNYKRTEAKKLAGGGVRGGFKA